MKIASEIYFGEKSVEMAPVLDELAEVIVQLRRISQLSRSILVKLDNRSQSCSPFEQLELETKNQSMHANMVRTGDAINQMNLRISELLQKCRASAVVFD